MAITHTTAADGTFSVTGSTAWNADHTIASGTITEAMQVLADNTTQDFSTTKHGYVPKGTNIGNFLKDDGTWAAPAGGATLNGITAATGAVTIASGNNTGIVWNWANTTDSTICHTLGETSAATNGTNSAGVPNQALFKLITLAASTQSPLSVWGRNAHIFSVSETSRQVLFTFGSATVPPISFPGTKTTGIFSAGTPDISFTISGTENASFLAGALQLSKGLGSAVGYALNFRKARGTVESPTVITTGDDLATISGFGYVGATNTYQEACRITFDSTGTISDSATGIGGIISFLHATVGAEPVVVAQLKSQHLIHSGTAPTITAGGGTNPSIVGTDESFCVTIGTGGIATSVEVTFGNAFTTNPPSVSVESDTDIIAVKITPLTTKVTITATAAFTAGSKLYCMTRGWE